MAINAAKAGKDVYSEKPCGITIALCQELAETMHRQKRVFQAGTQRRRPPPHNTASMAASRLPSGEGSAAQAAKSDKPSVFNREIVRIASRSPGAVKVHSFPEGKKALLAGKRIQYIGAVGEITFDRYRNSPGSFEIVKSDGVTPIVTYTAKQVEAAKGH